MSSWKLQKTQYGFEVTTTSGGTKTLTVDSKQDQVFTGAASHTLRLPDATLMKEGLSFTVINTSTGAITVQNNGLSTLDIVPAGGTAEFILTDNASANGVWRTYSAGAQGDGGIASVAPDANKTADYTVLSGDNGKVINVDSSVLSIEITLPAPSAGFNITIKDATGNANANNIHIIRSSDSVTIDGEVNDDILTEGYQAISYVSDGTQWFRISNHTKVDALGFFLGGYNGSIQISDVDRLSLTRLENGTQFGDLSIARNAAGACSSKTRGLLGGGVSAGPTVSNVIDYMEFVSGGLMQDFGDLTIARRHLTGCSNSTRGLFAGGLDSSNNYRNEIDYVTIASTGNAVDFGDLTVTGRDGPGASASTVRAVFAGGNNSGTVPQNIIDYVTIATTGNAIDFGDLTIARRRMATFSSATRGFWAGGDNGAQNTIDYVEIATLANAVGFGSLEVAAGESSNSAASKVVAVIGAGTSNRLQYLNMSTLSNSFEFGTLSGIKGDQYGSCSNAHGGL